MQERDDVAYLRISKVSIYVIVFTGTDAIF